MKIVNKGSFLAQVNNILKNKLKGTLDSARELGYAQTHKSSTDTTGIMRTQLAKYSQAPRPLG